MKCNRALGDLVSIGADVLNLQVSVMALARSRQSIDGGVCLYGGLDQEGRVDWASSTQAKTHMLDLLHRFNTPRGGSTAEVVIDDQISVDGARDLARTVMAYPVTQ